MAVCDSGNAIMGPLVRQDKYWVPGRGFNLSCHNKETVLFTIDPYYAH